MLVRTLGHIPVSDRTLTVRQARSGQFRVKLHKLGTLSSQMKITRRLLLFAASLFALPMTSWAATTGSISGTVKDPSGAVIPGASVTVTNTATGIQNKTMADSKGD